jgi:phosphoglycolate phosphatase-like HAD superfamily hydrolase
MEVAKNAGESGVLSVEKLLSEYGIEKWKKTLNYPAPVKESMLARVFDELFYGPELFWKQNRLEPEYITGGRPLIKNDRLAVSAKTMKRLHEMFGGRLAIVSGRSRLAAEYSLAPVMKYFDIDACVFLEDERREYAKPNPYAIKRAMEKMNARTAVYAGDSAEDLLMARRAEKETGSKIAFIGIYGNSPEPTKTTAQFRRENVEAIAKSVDQLPNTINKVLAV